MYTFTNVVKKRSHLSIVITLVGCLLITGCDSSTDGKLGSVSEPSFTTSPLPNNANKIVVESTTEDAFMWRWDFGNGATSEQEVDTVTYIEQGDYTVNLTAFSQGGVDSTSNQITIENDYQGQNVLPNDGAINSNNWTFLNTGGNTINVDYSNDTATFTSSQYTYGAIFLSAEVEAGVEYIFSAEVESSSGMGSQAWFEVYMGTTEPQQGSDYLDNKFLGINTYVPCGGSPFDGDIVDIACDGNGLGDNGIITFAESGTIYLVIKAGSNGGTLGQDGVTLKDINLAQL